MSGRERIPRRSFPRPADRDLRSAVLVERHRYSLLHVLIEGGSMACRLSVARHFHDSSLVRTGPFVSLDALTDHDALRECLLVWAGIGVASIRGNALRACERGTLFIDRVDAIDARTQRLLHAVVAHPAHELAPRPGRLIVGASLALASVVAAGEFLPTLFDSLDKVHVALAAEPEAA